MDVARATSIGTLTASWRALVRGSGGSVTTGPAFVAVRGEFDVFNNALLLAPEAEAVAAATQCYARDHLAWSLWSGDAPTAEVALRLGFVATGGTTDMARTL